MSKLTKALTAAAGNAAGESLYVEDVFSTYLYTGNSSTQTITNGIDLDGEGGLVWLKPRNQSQDHIIFDTVCGVTKSLTTNNTAAEYTATAGNEGLQSFNNDGFTTKLYQNNTGINNSSCNVASWTFRKAEKFFDVVSYTGNGVNGRQLPHSLGSTPGMVVCKRTDTGQNWILQHKSLDLSGNKTMYLNNTDALAVANDYWNSTHASSTAITLSGDADINGSGGTYVAYVFASDAGGFGDDGDENIIKCGSWNENSTNNVTIDCGFEPAFVMFKCADAASSWYMVDSMRGIPTPSSGTATGNYINTVLQANSGNAETSANAISLTSTGFTWYADGRLTNTAKWIYVAIRRPMKTPESGTEVFDLTLTENASEPFVSSAFPVDTGLVGYRSSGGFYWGDRIRGANELTPSSTAAEGGGSMWQWDYQDGWLASSSGANLFYSFKRATGFMDVVAYNGDNVEPRAIAHGLGVVPEMIIIKNRSGPYDWVVYHSGNTADPATEYLHLNANYATIDDDAMWKDTAPTASVFTTGNAFQNNHISSSYVAYLFASVAGVSKVGSYTGTGSNVDVDCGFAAGARFILIKRTDSTGDWYVWDSARGIVAGNDPYLLLNTTAAEVTGTDYIDPLSSGFTVTSSAPAALNASGGNYIFLAIA